MGNIQLASLRAILESKERHRREGAAMKEFRCKALGYDCSWKHFARTEDLLTDFAALHLREAHGAVSLDTAMLAKIRGTFSDPTPIEALKAEGLVLKEFRCSDLGRKCPWHYIAQTEELIVDGVAVHEREAHGVTEFTPEMKVKVEGLLRVWNA
jgi:predicted small metal-binding protein